LEQRQQHINAMSPNGATNQTVGLQWDLLSLLQQDPLNAPAASSTSSYQHVIILFADGLNTGDRWYGDFSNQSSQVDTRMKTLCDNIKAIQIRKYGKVEVHDLHGADRYRWCRPVGGTTLLRQ
jgi:hypothetical protein